MFGRPALSRTTLFLLAALFSAVTVLASAIWMIGARAQVIVTVELGFDSSFESGSRTQRVESVRAGSPAQRAGIRVGDRIVTVDGQPLADARSITAAWSRHEPGDAVRLLLLRPGEPAPIEVRATFRGAPSPQWLPHVGRQIHDLHPLPFVLVALTVLFLRVDDRNAWLLALLFSCFVATPGLPERYVWVAPPLRAFGLAHASVSLGLLGPLFYFFFTVFPARSPLDRRWPWLKWAAIVVGVALAVPGISEGGLRLPPPLAALTGEDLSGQVPVVFALGCFGLGLTALATSYWRNPDPEVGRKLRVIFWGTFVGVLPALTRVAIETLTPYPTPAALAMVAPLLGFVLPASFAYAVVKHRVLEIPVLLKRSARYLLVQRGFTFLLSVLSIGLTLLFAAWFTQYLPADGRAWGVSLGAVFGTCMLWSGLQVHRRVSGRIDRAFFRSAYDARVVLEELAGQSAAATDRQTLAHLLERHLVDALHPVSLVVYLQGNDGRLRAVAGTPPAGRETIAGETDLPPAVLGSESLDAGGEPGCVVPLMMPHRGLGGLLVLGSRLSEEPYSADDRRLLASVAGQAGIALETMALAEEIARRIESERRAAREMEIARDVQARLLPDKPPQLATLDCAAQCVQARAVGGDGYDFLDLGPGRVGFVLADVSGKGIHAALLMANLQAHLRSQSGIAPGDPVRVLGEVNRLLFRSTATQHYATVFFGIYDDCTRRFRYVNCGHNPPVLLRHGATEPVRLVPTAPVVGLFEEWPARIEEVTLDAGDLLAVFSDGVTEAMSGDLEFGEARFIDDLRAMRGDPATMVVARILDAVQQFSGSARSDDLTLLVLRGTAGAPVGKPAFMPA